LQFQQKSPRPARVSRFFYHLQAARFFSHEEPPSPLRHGSGDHVGDRLPTYPCQGSFDKPGSFAAPLHSTNALWLELSRHQSTGSLMNIIELIRLRYFTGEADGLPGTARSIPTSQT